MCGSRKRNRNPFRLTSKANEEPTANPEIASGGPPEDGGTFREKWAEPGVAFGHELRPNGVCTTRVFLVALGDSLPGLALGFRSLASAADAYPVRQPRQPGEDLPHLLERTGMAARLPVPGERCLDGAGFGLSSDG